MSVGVDVLKVKLKQTKYTLPDGRKLRDLVSDDEMKFDDTDPLQVTFDDSATSFTSFMDNITTPQCKIQVKWD